ncbi:MAG: lipopolysaccharide biosynthesis protein [Actinomycetota bacterium]
MARTVAAQLRRRWRQGADSFDGLGTDTIWSGVHDVAQLASAFTSFLLLQRVLDPATYGAYIGLYGLLATFGAMSFAGAGLALLQRLVGEGDDPDRTLRSFLSLTVVVGLAAASVAILIGATTLGLGLTEVALVVGAELFGAAVVFVSAMLVQAASGFPAATRVKLVVIVLRMAVLVTLFSTDSLTIANLGAGILVLFTVYAGYLLVVHLPRHGYRVSFGVPGTQAVRTSAMFSAPMGASRVQTDGDKYLLNLYGFAAEAGFYGLAYRMVLLGTLPLLALDTAAFQRFLPRGDGEPGLHWRRASHLGALMLAASMATALAIYLALPAFGFLFSDGFEEAAEIVPWLLFLIPLIATSNAPMNGLLGLGRADARMWIYLGAAAVSVVAYIVLIPVSGWRGAFWASVIGESVLSVTSWSTLWVCQRRADRITGASHVAATMSTA